MFVRMEWTHQVSSRVAPQEFCPVPADLIYAWGRVFYLSQSKYIEKGELANERKQNSLQNLS